MGNWYGNGHSSALWLNMWKNTAGAKNIIVWKNIINTISLKDRNWLKFLYPNALWMMLSAEDIIVVGDITLYVKISEETLLDGLSLLNYEKRRRKWNSGKCVKIVTSCFIMWIIIKRWQKIKKFICILKITINFI